MRTTGCVIVVADSEVYFYSRRICQAVEKEYSMKFDLHVHTYRSYDCISTIQGVVKYAKKAGLRGVAITDHDVPLTDDEEELNELRDNIWIIRGIEAQTEIGDIIGLFISDAVRSKTASDIIDEIHDQGGIVALAHPFKRSRSYPLKLLEKVDAVETVNARWKNLNFMVDDPAVRQLLSAVPGRSAGSDAHFLFEVGRGYLMTPVVETLGELKKVIMSGNSTSNCERYAPQLDLWSQALKFIRDPSLTRLARKICRFGFSR